MLGFFLSAYGIRALTQVRVVLNDRTDSVSSYLELLRGLSIRAYIIVHVAPSRSCAVRRCLSPASNQGRTAVAIVDASLSIHHGVGSHEELFCSSINSGTLSCCCLLIFAVTLERTALINANVYLALCRSMTAFI